jgi:predicted ester cyclase
MSAERNKATVQRMFVEAFRGNLDVIDEAFALDYVGHNPPTEGTEPMRGPESQKTVMIEAAQTFTELEMTINDLFGEDDKVALRLTLDGVFSHPIRNIPPTGKRFSIAYNMIFHFNDEGKIVEEWIERDTVQFLQVLGVFPQPTA